jgi:hypothetical protein
MFFKGIVKYIQIHKKLSNLIHQFFLLKIRCNNSNIPLLKGQAFNLLQIWMIWGKVILTKIKNKINKIKINMNNNKIINNKLMVSGTVKSQIIIKSNRDKVNFNKIITIILNNINLKQVNNKIFRTFNKINPWWWHHNLIKKINYKINSKEKVI